MYIRTDRKKKIRKTDTFSLSPPRLKRVSAPIHQAYNTQRRTSRIQLSLKYNVSSAAAKSVFGLSVLNNRFFIIYLLFFPFAGGFPFFFFVLRKTVIYLGCCTCSVHGYPPCPLLSAIRPMKIQCVFIFPHPSLFAFITFAADSSRAPLTTPRHCFRVVRSPWRRTYRATQ